MEHNEIIKQLLISLCSHKIV